MSLLASPRSLLATLCAVALMASGCGDGAAPHDGAPDTASDAAADAAADAVDDAPGSDSGIDDDADAGAVDADVARDTAEDADAGDVDPADADVELDGADTDAGDTADADTADADAADVDTADTNDATPDMDAETPDVPVFDAWPPLDPPPETLGFRIIDVGPLDEHRVLTDGVEVRDVGYGYGLVPLDVDGDLDLDLFVGTVLRSGQRACVYENVSRGGQPYFRQRDDWCAEVGAPFVGGAAVDMNGDGRHELVAIDPTRLVYVTFDPSWEQVDFETPTERCWIGSVLPFDLDRDGQLEILSSCVVTFLSTGTQPAVPANVWEQRPGDGAWVVAEDNPVAIDENALGLATFDVDGDGQQDVVTVVDTFGSPNQFDPTRVPGGVLRRCAPGADCAFERVPLAPSGAAWGSFMGLELFDLAGQATLVLGDLGPLAAFAWDDDASDEVSITLDDAYFGGGDSTWAFSWGLAADDFDDDGDEDLFAAFGEFALAAVGEIYRVPNTLFEQTEPGVFQVATRPLVVPEPSRLGDSDPISRAVVRADFDGDGVQELVAATANGGPIVYQHTGAAPRCTIRPRPRTVETWGAGYAVSEDGISWRPTQAHGELRSSDGPWLLVRESVGYLRFPSGAFRRYDCGDRNAIDIEEPDWLGFEFDGVTLIADLSDASWPGGIDAVTAAFTLEREPTPQLLDGIRGDDGRWRFAGIDASAGFVQIRINDTWVDRVWSVRALP